MAEEVSLLCASCYVPVPEGDLQCGECMHPSPSLSTLDPMRAIEQYGNLFRRGSSRPRAIALVGIWLLFLPSFLLSAILVFSPLQATARVVPAILALLSTAILLRSTFKYFDRSRNRRG